MKKYDKQLHDRLRHSAGSYYLNDHVRVDSNDIDALLDEIERLRSENSRIPGLQQSNNELCIEIQQANERIECLLSENRWIPVSEKLPIPAQKADGYMSDSSELVHVYPSPSKDRAVCYLHYLEKWSCSAEVNVTHWRPLPQPPEEEIE